MANFGHKKKTDSTYDAASPLELESVISFSDCHRAMAVLVLVLVHFIQNV